MVGDGEVGRWEGEEVGGWEGCGCIKFIWVYCAKCYFLLDRIQSFYSLVSETLPNVQ